MSVQALSWVLDFSETGATDRLVMISLGHHADNDGGFVSLARSRIAAETRLSEITVKRTLDRLVETPELDEITTGDGPEWWHAIRPDRRPRLFQLSLFAATRTGVRNAPPRGGATGVTAGARRGRDGVHATTADLERRAPEQRTENEEGTENVLSEAQLFDSGDPTPPAWLAEGLTHDEWIQRAAETARAG